jgi:DNA-binding SARP family transcriptional activator
MFSLKLLGGAAIDGPQGLLGGRVTQRRRLALLSVLALARERPVSRDKLLALFWPESDSDRARHSLADSLYQIRRELGETAILSTGDDLRVNPNILASDVGEFDAAVAHRDHARAVALYQGPFLDGLFLSEAPEFERWADAERERLARAYAGALEHLAEEATAEGDAKSAVEAWRRLAAEDPYNSRVTVRLLEALEAAGDQAGALRQARIHAMLLEEEFGAAPDPGVTALAERIRSGPATAPSPDREADVRDAKAPVAAPFPEVDTETAPRESTAFPEPAPISVQALPPRTRRWPLRGRAIGLLGALIVASSAGLAVGLLLPETSARSGMATEAAAPSPKALAVLPFVNLSRDPEEEYFSAAGRGPHLRLRFQGREP